MKNIVYLTLGALLFLTGVVLGTYIGVCYFFIGGVVGVVEVVNQMIVGSGVDGNLLGVSFIKLMFAGTAGTISAITFILPSMKIFSKGLS